MPKNNQKLSYCFDENNEIVYVNIKGKKVTKEELKELYIDQNLTGAEIGKHFGIGETSARKMLKAIKLSKNEYYDGKYFNSASFQSKAEKTMLEHYGVRHALQSEEILNKLKEKNLKKTGYAVNFSNPEILEKIKQTNLKKYGVENPFSNEEVKNKIHKTWEEKYGSYIFKQKDMTHLDIWNDDKKFVEFLQTFEKKPTTFELTKYFSCEETAVRNRVHSTNSDNLVQWNGNRSNYENELVDWLTNELDIHNMINNDRQQLGVEMDIYMPSYNMAIEFNGDFWHSEAFPGYQDHAGRSTKHQEKSLKAEKRGIFIFHIFEREWKDEKKKNIIKSRIRQILGKTINKLYARQCRIKEISSEEKKNFLNENHIQGNDHSSIQLGLFYQDTLVGCMTFIKSKNKYTWELSRFCISQNMSIVGGASKLFQYFLRHYTKPSDTIVSYSDFTKAKGELYSVLGFTFKRLNSPNYIWMNFKTGEIRTRYQEQKAGESQRMHNKGFYRVCDCGTKTWIFEV